MKAKIMLEGELLMKKIVLIGDSIRIGYEPYVRSAFRDIAEI